MVKDQCPSQIISKIKEISQALKRSFQGVSWCSFLKNSPETFQSQIYYGPFFGSFSFKKCYSKSPKVFRIVLQYFGDLFRESELESHSRAQLFFFGIKINTYFTHEPSCLVFAYVSIFFHLTAKACQISLDCWLFA